MKAKKEKRLHETRRRNDRVGKRNKKTTKILIEVMKADGRVSEFSKRKKGRRATDVGKGKKE